MIIDFHCHMGDKGEWAVKPEEKIARMDKYGIDVSVILGGAYEEEGVPSTAFSSRIANVRRTNDEIGKALKFSTRFEAFAMLNPLSPDATSLLDYCIKDLGMKGIKLVPYVLRHPVYCEPVFKLIDRAQEYRLPVAIHTGFGPAEIWDPPASVVALAAEYPEVRFVMLHMGSGVDVSLSPFGISQAIEGACRHDNIYLDTTSMPYPKKVKEAVERVGSERVVFGTDNGGWDREYEGQGGNEMEHEMDKIKYADLNKKDYENVMGRSAAILLGMKL